MGDELSPILGRELRQTGCSCKSNEERRKRRSEMTGKTVSEIERMVVTRVFDAPRELVWKAWTDPKYIMQWWGAKGVTSSVCKGDFRVGGKLLCSKNAPYGHEFWNAIEYHEIVPHEKIV